MADKPLCISGRNPRRSGSAPLPHPDVHTSYTRVLSSYPSCFLAKEMLVLVKKEAVLHILHLFLIVLLFFVVD